MVVRLVVRGASSIVNSFGVVRDCFSVTLPGLISNGLEGSASVGRGPFGQMSRMARVLRNKILDIARRVILCCIAIPMVFHMKHHWDRYPEKEKGCRMVEHPAAFSKVFLGFLVTVIVRLKWTINWYVNVVSLFTGQPSQFDTELVQVKAGHFLVQLLGDHMHVNRVVICLTVRP